jgi:hypothetical protein
MPVRLAQGWPPSLPRLQRRDRPTGWGIDIDGNPLLTNVDCFARITSLSGTLEIANNPLLDNIDGLGNIARVGDWVRINENAALVDIDPLSNITEIPGSLEIMGNVKLENVDGLSHLTQVGWRDNDHDWFGWVEIVDNPALSSLEGLASVETVAGGVTIADNTALPTCEARRFIDKLSDEGEDYMCIQDNLVDDCDSELSGCVSE